MKIKKEIIMKYKNIIFDMSEVIIQGIHGVENILEKETGISVIEYKQRRKEVNELFLDVMRGKVSEDEYYETLLKGTKWNISKEKLKKLIFQCLGKEVLGTKEIIKKLVGKYNLILLSDYPESWKKQIIDKVDILNCFEKKYFSCDYGYVKADEECFKYIIERENINPKETIFIDDYPSNIYSAEKFGIKGIVFKDSKQLEEKLKELEIL